MRTLNRRYELGEEIGRGGQAVVYAGRHVVSGQAVAIKVLPPSASPTALRRLAREARLLGSLHHPNTVRLLDIDLDDAQQPYLVFEFLHGIDLKQHLVELEASGQFMSAAEALYIADQLLAALHEAHALGLVHRDIKPANVMLCEVLDQRPHVKLVDFGIACLDDPAFAQSGAGLGTPAYMSPEQVAAGIVDGRSDLYSVGALLFRCLTGRLPFADADPHRIMQMHLAMPAPDVRALANEPLTEHVAAAVMRALQKQPKERFASAGDMRKALLGQGIERPAAASRPPPHSRAWAATLLVAALGLTRPALAPERPIAAVARATVQAPAPLRQPVAIATRFVSPPPQAIGSQPPNVAELPAPAKTTAAKRAGAGPRRTKAATQLAHSDPTAEPPAMASDQPATPTREPTQPPTRPRMAVD